MITADDYAFMLFGTNIRLMDQMELALVPSLLKVILHLCRLLTTSCVNFIPVLYCMLVTG